MILSPTSAVLVHGAASTPETALRLLGPGLAGSGLVAVDARGSIDDVVASIEAAVRTETERGALVTAIAGLSLGAHAAARWAIDRAGSGLELMLALPAWTGDPDAVAGLTAASADEIERDGTAGILARLVAANGDDWVVDELVRSWTDADPHRIAHSLRTAAASPAPTLDELAQITARTVVVALAGDPLHPARVAKAWAGAIPHGRLVVVPRDAPNRDRGALGVAARATLEGWVSGSR